MKLNVSEIVSKLKAPMANFKMAEFIAKLKGDKRLAMKVAGGIVCVLGLIGGGIWFLGGGGDTANNTKGANAISLDLGEMASGDKNPQQPSSEADGNAPPEGAAATHEGSAAPAPNSAETEPPKEETGPGSSVVVTMVTKNSFMSTPVLAAEKPLSPAPDDGLFEDSPEGKLPMISDDGRRPLQVYARPFDAPSDHPRIAIVITGMGLSAAATEAAIKRLPGAITLAFDANVKDYVLFDEMARKAGHETLISLPMESAKFPRFDPGPLAMLTSLKPQQNLERLNYILSRITGYVGITSALGSLFSRDEKNLRPILEAINKRGLMIVDNGLEPKSLIPKIAMEISLPRAVNNLFLDKNPSKAAIDSQLTKLEEIARENAVAIAYAEANPSTIERLSAWIATLKKKNLVLAPISAIADRQILN